MIKICGHLLINGKVGEWDEYDLQNGRLSARPGIAGLCCLSPPGPTGTEMVCLQGDSGGLGVGLG